MAADAESTLGETLIVPRSGNRCGHDPRVPRWFEPPPEHKERPPIIVKWIDRLKQFYRDPNRIPSLANALLGRKRAADPEGDHKSRQMRSERREACCDLLGAIAHYCDLPTLCLSVPQPDGSLLPLTLETLAERAGLGLRRAERAMRDIVSAGLVSVHPRCELRDDGTYIGRAAIRVVPPSFFGLFGLEARLEHDRRRIGQKRREARAEAPAGTAGARIGIAMRAVLGKITGSGSRPTPPPTAVAEIPLPDAPHAQHIRDMKAILAGDSPSSASDLAGLADRQTARFADTSIVGSVPVRGGSRDPPS
jgi:hypothetical protein